MAAYLMLNDIPRFAAITLVAPTVRFRALAILLAPFLSFAIVFNVRWSSFDHRRTTLFLATLDSFFEYDHLPHSLFGNSKTDFIFTWILGPSWTE
jgi:hypothetical protein